MRRYWFWQPPSTSDSLNFSAECRARERREEQRRRNPCQQCHGRRIVPAEDLYPSKWCPRCEGSGIEPPPKCTVCKGEKVIPALGAWVMEGDTDPCHHCGQTGVEPIQNPS